MTLYISDLDGTLLHPSGTVSANTQQILTELIQKGLHFTVATARTPLSALPLLQNIPIQDPMILMNGALFYNPATKVFSDPVPFGQDTMAKLAEAEKLSGMEGMLFSSDGDRFTVSLGNVKDCMWNGYFDLKKVVHIDTISQTIQPCSAAQLQNADVVYGLYMDNEPTKLEILVDLLKDSGLTLDYYQDKYTENRWCLEICSCNATKGNAVKRLKQRGYNHLVGFGDSWNDVPLFRACDEGYAVANASDNLKQIATNVIGSNAEDGVAVHILQHHKF